MTLRQAAQLTGLSDRTIRNYVAQGLLWLRKRPPGHYEVTREDIQRILRVHRCREEMLAGWTPGLWCYLQGRRQAKLDNPARELWRL